MINVAGIIQPFVDVVDLEITHINRVMDVNFYGTVVNSSLARRKPILLMCRAWEDLFLSLVKVLWGKAAVKLRKAFMGN